ncbi:hypothetical protein F4782DRAFT_535106 [Xylaria castorea]|nr:hypothetical protein F4782DRAFT_535106 [Xylaria castorea]
MSGANGRSSPSSSPSPSPSNRYPCPQPHLQPSALPARGPVQLPSHHPLGDPPKDRHISAVSSIYKYWTVFPWDVVAADQQPGTWSDNLLDKFVRLARCTTLPWAHDQLQRTITQGKTLAPRDLDIVWKKATEQDPQTGLPRAPPNPQVTATATATATASTTTTTSRERHRTDPVANLALVGSTATPHLPHTPPFGPPRRLSMTTSSEAATGETDTNSNNDNSNNNNKKNNNSSSSNSIINNNKTAANDYSKQLSSPRPRSRQLGPPRMSATSNTQDTSSASVQYHRLFLETNEGSHELETDGMRRLGQPSLYRKGTKRLRLSAGTDYSPSVTPVLTAPNHLPFDIESGSKEVLAHFLSIPGARCHLLRSKCAKLDETRKRAQDRLEKLVAELQPLESKKESLQHEVFSQEKEIADKEMHYQDLVEAEKRFADASKVYHLARQRAGIIDAQEVAPPGNSGESSQARRLIDDLQTKLQAKKEELVYHSSYCERVDREIEIAKREVDETTNEWETACDEYGKWCQLLNFTTREVSELFGSLSIRAGPNDEVYGAPGRTITLVSADQLQFTETTPPRHSRSAGGMSAGS